MTCVGERGARGLVSLPPLFPALVRSAFLLSVRSGSDGGVRARALVVVGSSVLDTGLGAWLRRRAPALLVVRYLSVLLAVADVAFALAAMSLARGLPAPSRCRLRHQKAVPHSNAPRRTLGKCPIN